MRFYFHALGCKLNQAELEALARRVKAIGHQVVKRPQDADWAIINTCTVTHVAARKSRQLIRQLRRLNPQLRLAVTGCYAQTSAHEVWALDGVELVIANADKERLLEYIPGLAPLTANTSASIFPLCGPGQLGRTRAFVKIQDGCDNRCTYCIVAVARGPQRSRPPTEIVEEVRARALEGYQEVVLTGVHIGAYGRDSAPDAPLPASAGWSLARLVQVILNETPIRRLRLSSIEPWDLSLELLQLWPNPRLCRHVHLPLQSGCDETLRRMGRKYTTQQFAQLVQALRERVPEVSITTDVIVGFPGESDEEFRTSLAFIETMRFARLHVFKYSPRPGTPAFNMPDAIPPPVAQARSEALIALGRRLSLDFHRRFVGHDVEVLFESARRCEGVLLWSGLTDNYLHLSVPATLNLTNVLAKVRCLAASASGLRGELHSFDRHNVL